MTSEPGTITSASPVLVQLDSSDTAAPALCLASYTPVLNDRVAVIVQGGQLLVLGRVV